MDNAQPDLRIDRLRGYFAILVMVGHAMDVAQLSVVANSSPTDLGAVFLGPIRGFFGFLWVIGFIVVSGYCIARSCEQQGDQFTLASYGVARATRIYPLLFSCALLALCIELCAASTPYRPDIWASGIDVTSFVSTAAGLSWFGGTFGSLAPSYTITYELIYYAIWGMAWALLWRRPWTALAAATSLWLLLYLVEWKFIHPAALIFICWLIGAAAWILRREILTLVRGVPIIAAWLTLIVLAAAIAISQTTWSAHPSLVDTGVATAIKYILLGLAFSFLIVAYVSKPRDEAQTVLDRLLGELSYPLFLIHGPIVIFVGYLVNYFALKITYSVYLAVLCAISIAVAYALVVTVERPIMAWRRSIARKRLSPRGPVALGYTGRSSG